MADCQEHFMQVTASRRYPTANGLTCCFLWPKKKKEAKIGRLSVKAVSEQELSKKDNDTYRKHLSFPGQTKNGKQN